MDPNFFYFAIGLGVIVLVVAILAAAAVIIFPSGLQECSSSDAMGFMCMTLPCTLPLVLSVALFICPCIFVSFACRIRRMYLARQLERRKDSRRDSQSGFPNHFRYSFMPLSPMSKYSVVKPVILASTTPSSKPQRKLSIKREASRAASKQSAQEYCSTERSPVHQIEYGVQELPVGPDFYRAECPTEDLRELEINEQEFRAASSFCEEGLLEYKSGYRSPADRDIQVDYGKDIIVHRQQSEADLRQPQIHRTPSNPTLSGVIHSKPISSFLSIPNFKLPLDSVRL